MVGTVSFGLQSHHLLLFQLEIQTSKPEAFTHQSIYLMITSIDAMLIDRHQTDIYNVPISIMVDGVVFVRRNKESAVRLKLFRLFDFCVCVAKDSLDILLFRSTIFESDDEDRVG